MCGTKQSALICDMGSAKQQPHQEHYLHTYYP